MVIMPKINQEHCIQSIYLNEKICYLLDPSIGTSGRCIAGDSAYSAGGLIAL